MTSSRDYLLEHLVVLPAFRALLRSIEARMVGVRECRSYFSRSASHLFDLAHYYSALTIIYIRLLGRRIIAPWRANFVLIEPLLRHFYNEPLAADGASLFIVCERQ